jgi:hypothetical protein
LTRLTILPHVCLGTLHMRDEGCKASLHWNKTIYVVSLEGIQAYMMRETCLLR